MKVGDLVEIDKTIFFAEAHLIGLVMNIVKPHRQAIGSSPHEKWIEVFVNDMFISFYPTELKVIGTNETR